MFYKRVSFICILFLCLQGVRLFSSEQKSLLYDYDVLQANPDLIQQKSWENSKSQYSVQKEEVKGIYDIEAGGIYAESRTSSESEARVSVTSKSQKNSNQRGIASRLKDDQVTFASQSFSSVSEQVRSSAEGREKRRKSMSDLRAFGAQESRLFDFDEKSNPEFPDLETVVTDNVKPAVSPE